MLIQFRVENHRSLRDEHTITMLAADPDDGRLIHSAELGESLLPAIAIYGANASGKSNALSALMFMRSAVFASHRLWEPDAGTPNDPFAFSSKADESSLYEVDFLLDGTRYRYGFVLDASKIVEEWLYAWPKGRRQLWFSREANIYEFGKNLHGENETIRGLTRDNSLFLSAAAQNNHPSLTAVFGWFRANFEFRPAFSSTHEIVSRENLGVMFSPHTQQSLFNNEDQQRDRDVVLGLLRAADTGILEIRAKSESADSSPSLGSIAPGARRPRTRFDVQFRHKAADDARGWLPLNQESAGTITLVALATRLTRVLANGSLLCVDEIDSSLHPMLIMEILKLFQTPERNPHGAQLLFTTHDTTLLGNISGPAPLRRDQVWFAEKDDVGATHLYPLTEYRPRREENLERGYLQGRYGAVPFIGELVPAPKMRPSEDD